MNLAAIGAGLIGAGLAANGLAAKRGQETICSGYIRPGLRVDTQAGRVAVVGLLFTGAAAFAGHILNPEKRPVR